MTKIERVMRDLVLQRDALNETIDDALALLRSAQLLQGQKQVRDTGKFFSCDAPDVVALRELFDSRKGIFKSDLLSADDVRAYLEQSSQRPLTNNRVGKMISDVGGCVKLHAQKTVDGKQVQKRVWAIRNVENYVTMSSTQVYLTYVKMLANFGVPKTLDEPPTFI